MGATQRIPDWPTTLPPMLLLGRDGQLWVVHRGIATRWARGVTTITQPGYLWAQFDHDGSILASRAIGHRVEIDRLTAPGKSTVAVSLPFTVKAAAPKGVCPIDGYLAEFGISSSGLTLVHHMAGPIDHSCPAGNGPAATDPWRCTSAEGATFETRRHDYRAKGENAAGFLGIGPSNGGFHLVGASRDAPAIALDTNGTVAAVAVVGSEQQHGCDGCLTGPRGDTLGALRPDGEALVTLHDNLIHVTHPKGIGTFGEPVTAPPSTLPGLGLSPGPVTALAWTGATIAVADGPSRLALIGANSGNITVFDSPPRSRGVGVPRLDVVALSFAR